MPTLIINPAIEDTFVQSNDDTDKSAATILRSGDFFGATTRAFIRFGLVAALPAPPLPVTLATLSIHVANTNDSTIFIPDGTWVDTDTWTTIAAGVIGGISKDFTPGAKGTVNIDVTALVQSIVDNAYTQEFTIRGRPETEAFQNIDSLESANPSFKPSITVIYPSAEIWLPKHYIHPRLPLIKGKP